MVWTAVVRRNKMFGVDAVIFESHHDSNLAYADLVSRLKADKKFDVSEVVVMIPGRHTFVFFPDKSEENV